MPLVKFTRWRRTTPHSRSPLNPSPLRGEGGQQPRLANTRRQPVSNARWPLGFTPCRFGNRRYSRFGNLRYRATASRPRHYHQSTNPSVHQSINPLIHPMNYVDLWPLLQQDILGVLQADAFLGTRQGVLVEPGDLDSVLAQKARPGDWGRARRQERRGFSGAAD